MLKISVAVEMAVESMKILSQLRVVIFSQKKKKCTEFMNIAQNWTVYTFALVF